MSSQPSAKTSAKPQRPWIRFRHRVVTAIGRPVIHLVSRLKYNIRITPFREQGNRQYLVLMNHQTPFDQFFIASSFRGPVYYLATEDIFSNGFVSSLIRYLVAPIPIKKQTMDIGAVKNCLRVAREGGTIALAPEGNRTYSGKTEYMNPSIADLAKTLGLPVALYRIEGGYGAQPRWSDGIRKGRMQAGVSRVIEPEEYKQMTNEQLFEEIRQGLFVDEGRVDIPFRSRKRAEYLERAMYVCPWCGLAEFESQGNFARCKVCSRQIEYMPTKELRGVGCEFPFRFMGQWYDYQQEFVNALNPDDYIQTPLFRDTASLSQVIVSKKKIPLRKDARVALYGDRVVIDEGELVFPFEQTAAMSVLGRNKLNLYFGDKVYQFKGSCRFNALKYVNIYYRNKNIRKGHADGKFLGL